MALDLITSSYQLEARPNKRRRLTWDDAPPVVTRDDDSLLSKNVSGSYCLHALPAAKSEQDANSERSMAGSFPAVRTVPSSSLFLNGGRPASPPWRGDDKDGHYMFEFGENLTPRYKILSKMGEGTFGRVLQCWDREAQEPVAIKVIRNVQKYRDAAMIEIDVLRVIAKNDKTASRGCVQMRSWFDYRNHICIVCEKLGPSLFDFLKVNNYRPFSIDLVREFGKQLLESVAYMHDLNLIHTDLKPENVLLVSSDSLKVVDYKGEALFQTHENLEHLAMMERVLGPIPQHIINKADRRAEKYFRHGRELNWPEGAASRESIRAVRRLQRLRVLPPFLLLVFNLMWPGSIQASLGDIFDLHIFWLVLSSVILLCFYWGNIKTNQACDKKDAKRFS